MGRGEGFAITINERNAAIHITNNQRVHFQQRRAVIFKRFKERDLCFLLREMHSDKGELKAQHLLAEIGFQNMERVIRLWQKWPRVKAEFRSN